MIPVIVLATDGNSAVVSPIVATVGAGAIATTPTTAPSINPPIKAPGKLVVSGTPRHALLIKVAPPSAAIPTSATSKTAPPSPNLPSGSRLLTGPEYA